MMRNILLIVILKYLNLSGVLQNTGKDKSECHSDFECSSYEVCKENSCVESCDVLKCGKNAYCDVGDHNAVCKCLDGFHVGLNKTCLSSEYF